MIICMCIMGIQCICIYYHIFISVCFCLKNQQSRELVGDIAQCSTSQMTAPFTGIRPISMAMQQEPKLEVPTIYKAYVRAMQGISAQNIALYGTVPPFQGPENPTDDMPPINGEGDVSNSRCCCLISWASSNWGYIPQSSNFDAALHDYQIGFGVASDNLTQLRTIHHFSR